MHSRPGAVWKKRGCCVKPSLNAAPSGAAPSGAAAMAPKKKDGKKKDAKKKDDGASAELSEKEMIEQYKLRVESLERQLGWREEKLQASLAAQAELKTRVDLYHSDFKREKEEIFDISADMSRQYKGMQEELLSKVSVGARRRAATPRATPSRGRAAGARGAAACDPNRANPPAPPPADRARSSPGRRRTLSGERAGGEDPRAKGRAREARDHAGRAEEGEGAGARAQGRRDRRPEAEGERRPPPPQPARTAQEASLEPTPDHF